MANKLITIVIVAYKNADCIGACLSSIAAFNDIGEALDVAVVDNSPEGDTTGALVQEKFPWVRYIRNLKNSGCGAGNNLGVEDSQAKYFLFMNPDMEFIEPVFKWTVENFEKDPKLGLFGIRLVDKFRNPTQSFAYMPHRYNLLNQSFRIEAWRNRKNLPPKEYFTVGADLFIRRDVFEQIGRFDERIFLYFEETDVLYRVQQTGYKACYFPEKQMIHLEGQSTNDMPRQKFMNYHRTMKFIIEKHKDQFPSLEGKLKLIHGILRMKFFLTRRKKFREYAEDLGTIMEGKK